MTFLPGQPRACYNQSVVNDNEPEDTESFNVSIINNPDITPGDPDTARINIVDDDGRELFLVKWRKICDLHMSTASVFTTLIVTAFEHTKILE